MTQTFRSSPTAQIMPTVGAVGAFVLALRTVGIDQNGELSGFGYVIVIGAGLVLFNATMSLIRPTVLTLTDQGFTWKSWRYAASFSWCDIASFGVGRSITPLSKPKVAFTFKSGRVAERQTATAVNRAVNGYDRSMNNVWGIQTDELVGVLNGYLAGGGGSFRSLGE